MRYRTAILLGCTALAAFAPLSVRAEDEASQETSTVLQTITVEGAGAAADDDSKTIVATTTSSGSKMPTDIMNTAASVSAITAKEIQQRGADSVEQVLQYTPGSPPTSTARTIGSTTTRSAASMPGPIATA